MDGEVFLGAAEAIYSAMSSFLIIYHQAYLDASLFHGEPPDHLNSTPSPCTKITGVTPKTGQ